MLLSNNLLWASLCLTTHDSVISYLALELKGVPDQKTEAVILDFLDEQPNSDTFCQLCETVGARLEFPSARKKLASYALSAKLTKTSQALLLGLSMDAETDPQALALLDQIIARLGWSAQGDFAVACLTSRHPQIRYGAALSLLSERRSIVSALSLLMRDGRLDLVDQALQVEKITVPQVICVALREHLQSPSQALVAKYLVMGGDPQHTPLNWYAGNHYTIIRECLPELPNPDVCLAVATLLLREIDTHLGPAAGATFLAKCRGEHGANNWLTLLSTIERKRGGRILACLARHPEVRPSVLLQMLAAWADLNSEQRHSFTWQESETASIESARSRLAALPISPANTPLFSEKPTPFTARTLAQALRECGLSWRSFFEQTDAGALVKRLSQHKERSPEEARQRQQLIATWFEECAAQEEWDAALPVVASTICPTVEPWAARASAQAYVPFVQSTPTEPFPGSGASHIWELAECLKGHREAQEILPLFATHAVDKTLRAYAWSVSVGLGYTAPILPAGDTDLLMRAVGFLKYSRGVPSSLEVQAVETLLQAPQTKMEDHQSLDDCLWGLWVVGCAASRKDFIQAARELWLKNLLQRKDIDYCAGIWDGAKNETELQDLGSVLKGLSSERLKRVIEHLPVPVIDWLARRQETPNVVRLEALARVATEETFNPGNYNLTKNPALVADYLEYSRGSWEPKIRQHAISVAVAEVIAHPAKTEDIEDQSTPMWRLRQGLREIIAKNPAEATHALEAMKRLRRRVQEAIDPKDRPTMEVLVAWVRALGVLRERRSAKDLNDLKGVLLAEERAYVGAAIEVTCQQMTKPPHPEGSEGLVVQMALDALRLVPLR